jgi:arylsulfatase A-like enzyme
VPLFVRGPGVAAGATTEKLALNTDFAPTFAELAGASFEADGRSLVPLLQGEELSSWRSSVLLEKLPQADSSEEAKGGTKAKGKAKDKAKDKTGAGGVPKAGSSGQLAFEAVRTERYKYVEHENGEKELYDLQNDPYEMESIHETAEPSLVEDLKARLEALKSCSEEGCREAEDVP